MYLAEIHRFDTFTAQRRTDWRTGTGLASPNNQLHNLICCRACFRHGDVVVVGESLTRRGFDIWQIKLPVRGPCKRCPGFESRAKNYPPSNMKDMSIGFVSLFLGLLSYSLLRRWF